MAAWLLPVLGVPLLLEAVAGRAAPAFPAPRTAEGTPDATADGPPHPRHTDSVRNPITR
ncbi:hypothetical protein ACFXC9_12730 [Streptomyces naganishii]|uniref:hypothetical protein n=1 Tax=Streptomyces naganishii TaxID=285447 RepID=UPI0036A0DFBA